MFGEGDMEVNGVDKEPRVTDIDEVSFHFDRPLATIPGITYPYCYYIYVFHGECVLCYCNERERTCMLVLVLCSC